MISWLLLFASPSQAPGVDHEVRVETIEGRPWFTVRAQNVSAERILAQVVRTSGHDLESHVSFDRAALVTVALVRRPLDQVLEYLLGSIGLRHELRQDAIVVLPDEAESAEQGLELANDAWIRAAGRFPAHPSAPAARLAQGEIAELRGELELAREGYLGLIEDYPQAGTTGEATMRAGRISARLGQWGEASRLYRSLANLDSAPEYHAAARLEWARAMVTQGESQAALQMLSALESTYPTASPIEESARRLVRARALNARGLHMEALQELDLSEAHLDPLAQHEALEIRASALAGIGLPAEAGRAWLLVAQDAREGDQVYAYQQAAELALEARDELAALFVVREARARGVELDLAYVEHEARARLGLVEEESAGVAERLAQAEVALDRNDIGRAAEVLETLFLARGAVDEETSARISVAWARCVESRESLERALALLSEVRRAFSSAEAQRLVDLGAAALFEKNARFEEAIDAYEGRYQP